MQKLIFIVLVSLLFAHLVGCEGNHAYNRDVILMDTFVRIEIRDKHSRIENSRIAEKAISAMKQAEKELNIYKNEGEVSIVNNLKKGEELTISPQLFGVLAETRRVSVITNGYFDITILPVIRLWKKAKEESKMPSDENIKSILQRVGLSAWSLNKEHASIKFLKDGVKIDLGGIAKGYVVDAGIISLVKSGVKNAIINAGGDMYCLGKTAWKIGIRDPGNTENITSAILVSNRGVATSGSYERYFEINGNNYSHIIDPKSGYPVNNDIESVTTIAESCMLADVLSTAVFVVGSERGMELIESIKDAECIIIEKGGEEKFSSGALKYKVELKSS